jgi:hypothetical protein
MATAISRSTLHDRAKRDKLSQRAVLIRAPEAIAALLDRARSGAMLNDRFTKRHHRGHRARALEPINTEVAVFSRKAFDTRCSISNAVRG